MEDLTSLMTQIDALSQNIPEGAYLDMCNTMRTLHDKLKTSQRDLDPPIIDSRRVPFSVYRIVNSDGEVEPMEEAPPGHDQDYVEVEVEVSEHNPYDEWIINMERLDALKEEITRIDKFIRDSKHRSNITKKVKVEAVRELAGEYGVELEVFTMDALREKISIDILPHQEKAFYREYLKRDNERKNRAVQQLSEDRRALADETSMLLRRNAWLREFYSL